MKIPVIESLFRNEIKVRAFTCGIALLLAGFPGITGREKKNAR